MRETRLIKSFVVVAAASSREQALTQPQPSLAFVKQKLTSFS